MVDVSRTATTLMAASSVPATLDIHWTVTWLTAQVNTTYFTVVHKAKRNMQSKACLGLAINNIFRIHVKVFLKLRHYTGCNRACFDMSNSSF